MLRRALRHGDRRGGMRLVGLSAAWPDAPTAEVRRFAEGLGGNAQAKSRARKPAARMKLKHTAITGRRRRCRGCRVLQRRCSMLWLRQTGRVGPGRLSQQSPSPWVAAVAAGATARTRSSPGVGQSVRTIARMDGQERTCGRGAGHRQQDGPVLFTEIEPSPPARARRSRPSRAASTPTTPPHGRNSPCPSCCLTERVSRDLRREYRADAVRGHRGAAAQGQAVR